ncbi:MAG: hypothetical protein CMF45_08895 [Legionellales bacterium]|nr:hypothetical protein [Legionellales bacterium]|tara:strand:+ start:180 stop:476 length:297 start_codon:yes stop_codon:yes gene_type:complete
MGKTEYEADLEWQRRYAEFERDHLAILLGCSRKRWMWTTWNRLVKTTGLTEENLLQRAKELGECGAVVIRKDNEGRVLIALRERLVAWAKSEGIEFKE